MKLFERQMARLVAVLLAAVAVLGLCTFVVASFLRSSVSTVSFTNETGPVNLTLQTVGQVGFGIHPSWVGYLVRDEKGNWIRSTLWQLPANRTIDVTLYEYDSGGALRNPVWGGVAGTVGGSASVNGKTTSVIDPGAGNGIAHSFNVPELNINVPLYGISSKAKNPCSGAPCALSNDHNTVKFSFHTPAGAGNYRWQCFVPCGLAYLRGNGGPMAAIGYMSGFLNVVPV